MAKVKEQPILSTKIMNRASRAFQVAPSEVISGGILSEDKKYVSLFPGKTIELIKDASDRLLKMFPSELIDLSIQGK